MSKVVFAGAALLVAFVSSAEGRAAYPYRDAALPTERRVADLISRMSIEEKCMQLGKLRGFRSYERASDGTIVPNADVRELLAKTPVGTIYGVLRADWWTKRDWNTGVVPERYVQAFNAFQKIAVEESRWGIPIFFTEEAPHGLMALGEPVYPTGLGLGSTFDEDLLYRIGLQVGSSRKRGVHGVKAPILDLARDPRWSRCEECFGEDPELVSMLGAAMFRGLYESGMQPCLKHYVGGGASEGGHNCSPVHMGPMELFNGPLRPFRRCINAGARHLMCTYHDIDGEPCTGSRWLLTEVLRGHLGFRGFVTSDAGATSAPFWYRLCRTDTEARAISLKAGCDIESGYNTLKESGRELLKGVKEGLLTEADLDRALSRLLAVKFDMGLFEHPYADESEVSPSKLKDNKSRGDALALEAARKSLVLMKNNGTLPLVRKEPTLAVIGPNAGGKIMNQLGDYTAPQLRKDVLTVLDGVEPFAKSVSYAQGCKIRSKSKAGFAEAENLAAQADVTILVLGGSSSPYGAVDLSDEMAGASIVTGRESDDYDKESGEGTDRCTLGYSGVQEDLFRAVRKKAKKLVVVLIQGRALAVSEIVREADAVLLAWYPGSQGGRAIGEALFGLVNPGGKLPVSLAYSAGQLPVCGDGIGSKRRLYIDGPGDAEFPFGYGLSYTTFAFSDLAVDLERGEVSVCVKNTGTREGDEVVRFYFTALESQAVRPWRELFDFARVTVLPGETKKVVRKLDVGKFGYYNRLGAFVKPSGAYTVSVDGCEQNCEVTFGSAAAVAGIAATAKGAAYVQSEGGEELRLFQTTESKDFREIATPGFTIHPYPGVEALDIDKAIEKHEFLGLGASLTDASAWILANMPKEKREKLLRELFTPEGCNLGAMRLNIGASDYSTGLYSYDDTPGDVDMKNFSLARDDEFLVPMAKAVKAIRPDVYVFASPWSPPGWMKTSGLMIGGNLKDEYMPALANYFVKYVQGYGERGIAIDAVSPQNEAMCDTHGQYPCCVYTAEQEGAFARDFLKPAFRKACLATKIWVHDHNPDTGTFGENSIARVEKMLSLPGVEDSIDGVAWHCYGAPTDATNLPPIKAAHLKLRFYHTENGPHVVAKDRTENWWAKKVFTMLQNGCEMFTSWNLCLDELGTPATGAHLCGGFVVVDSETHDVTYSPQYRLFRHIGPFVKRGAHVMEVSGARNGTELILFRNPDGEYVLVVAGTPPEGILRRRLVVKYKGRYKTLPLPGAQWSVSTLVFK